MIRIKVKLGARGQFVIPKIVRESLGLIENKQVILEVTGKKIEIKPLNFRLAEEWEELAQREGADIAKEFVYGDRLYEELYR